MTHPAYIFTGPGQDNPTIRPEGTQASLSVDEVLGRQTELYPRSSQRTEPSNNVQGNAGTVGRGGNRLAAVAPAAPTHRPYVNTPESLFDVGRKVVDANVGEIADKWVVFHLKQSDREATIRLPRDIVPAELLQFGKAVEISLESRNGMRCPIIRARVPVCEPFDDDLSLEEWLNAI